MTVEERSNIVLALARVLYVNGQSTDETLAAAEQFSGALGLQAEIIPHWGELELEAENSSARVVCSLKANPTGVEMDRVVSAMRAVEDFDAARLAPAAAMEKITA